MGGDLIVGIVSVAATAHLHISFTSTSPPCCGGTSFGFRLASSLGRMYFLSGHPLVRSLKTRHYAAPIKYCVRISRKRKRRSEERRVGKDYLVIGACTK